MRDDGAAPFWRSFCGLGLVFGALFFAAALTPSLIPRGYLLQGILGGVSLAIGYGMGVFLLWLWDYLELPILEARVRIVANWAAASVAAIIVAAFLWQTADWQNSIRERMGMTPVETAHPLKVALIAIVVFIALTLLARLFWLVFRLVARRLERIVPRRVARVVGIAFTALLFALIIDGLLLRSFLRVADASFKTADALIEPDIAPPSDPNKTGSAASLIGWQELGRAGRDYVSSGPTGEELRALSGEDALEPLRVYVGLNAADSHVVRAQLALQELIRVGGFERAVLIVAVPTGTGWMDPTAMDTIEYLHRGDIATVAMQYSYLTSWISLLVEPDYGTEAGRALFAAVYDHWSDLPEASRPRLYIYGLSLGALSSEQSVGLHEVIADPFHGALWVGPPFPGPIWQRTTAAREPGSPAWRPRFGDGSFMRFTNHGEALDLDGAEWGPMRVVYLQHASDPIVFFEPRALYRRPDWMDEPPGPDVSPELRWYPVVTFLQLLVDMAIGLLVPMGHGHLYSYADHINPWIEVTEPEGWTADDIERLKRALADRQAR